ncbi:hypothetical protein Ae331Ps2_6354c [Pseudonocardia sp. Ae331_Ps2]|nr:hypothetical protein Ae331Ps2_6354c [Pseudonocardia sp. Ae331_Ps2]
MSAIMTRARSRVGQSHSEFPARAGNSDTAESADPRSNSPATLDDDH